MKSLDARLFGRLLATLAIVGAVFGAVMVPIPGTWNVGRFAPNGPALLGLFNIGTPILSFGSIGLASYLGVFVAVEAIVALVPSLRHLRRSLDGRRRLDTIVLVIVVPLVVFQSSMVVSYIRATPALTDVVEQPAVATAMLAAGAIGSWLLLGLVARVGIGNGFALLLVAAQLVHSRTLVFFFDEHVGTPWLKALAVVPLTWWILTRHRGEATVSYRSPRFAGVVLLAVFAAGIQTPLAAVVGVGGIIYLLIARQEVRAADPKRLFEELVYVGVIAALGLIGVPVVALALATAVALDLGSELQARRVYGDLVVAGAFSSVDEVDRTLETLTAAGVVAHARNTFFRSLLRFFAPFSYVEILVPRAQVDKARALLATE